MSSGITAEIIGLGLDELKISSVSSTFDSFCLVVTKNGYALLQKHRRVNESEILLINHPYHAGHPYLAI